MEACSFLCSLNSVKCNGTFNDDPAEINKYSFSKAKPIKQQFGPHRHEDNGKVDPPPQ